MTERMIAFCDEYIKRKRAYGAAKAAALAAGYTEKSASVMANNILKREDAQKYIEEREVELEEALRRSFLYAAADAQKAMTEILTKPSADDRDIIAAAKDILDRAGFTAVEKKEVSVSAPQIIDDIGSN